MANTNLVFDKNQKLNPISGYQFVIAHLPWRIKFYNDGNPKEVQLETNQLINGIPCKKKYDPILLYPDGKIKECAISKNFKINNVLYKKGDILKFDKTGKIQNNK